jgi:hypothetical protein
MRLHDDEFLQARQQAKVYLLTIFRGSAFCKSALLDEGKSAIIIS